MKKTKAKSKKIHNPKRANFYKSMNISLITGLSFGAVATAVAVPIQLMSKEDGYEVVNLYDRLPGLRKLLCMDEKTAAKTLNDLVLVDQVNIGNFRKRRRRKRAAVHHHHTVQVEEKMEIYRKSHFDNNVIIVTYYKDETNQFVPMSSLIISGAEATNIMYIYSTGIKVLGGADPIVRNLTADIIDCAEDFKAQLAYELGAEDHEATDDEFISPKVFDNFEDLIDLKVIKENEAIKDVNEHLPDKEKIMLMTKDDVIDQLLVAQESWTDSIVHRLEDYESQLKQDIYASALHEIEQVKNNDLDYQMFKNAFSTPALWMDALANMITSYGHTLINGDGTRDIEKHLNVMKDYITRFAPYGTMKATQELFHQVIDITFGALPRGSKERFEAEVSNYHRVHSVEMPLINKIRLAHNIVNELNQERFWAAPTFETVVNKPHGRSKLYVVDVKINRISVEDRHFTPTLYDQKWIIAKIAQNPVTHFYGIKSYNTINVDGMHDGFMQELINRVNEDVSGIGPASRYLHAISVQDRHIDADINAAHLNRLFDVINSKDENGHFLGGYTNESTAASLHEVLNEIFERNTIDLLATGRLINISEEIKNNLLVEIKDQGLYNKREGIDEFVVAEEVVYLVAEAIHLPVDKDHLRSYFETKRKRKRRRR